ncbi:hypothetical protein SAMN04488550_4140 [Gordonia malaquae]|nr:hypothetical protein SAMN04488550_4140 [Gordonia malaquae]
MTSISTVEISGDHQEGKRLASSDPRVIIVHRSN